MGDWELVFAQRGGCGRKELLKMPNSREMCITCDKKCSKEFKCQEGAQTEWRKKPRKEKWNRHLDPKSLDLPVQQAPDNKRSIFVFSSPFKPTHQHPEMTIQVVQTKPHAFRRRNWIQILLGAKHIPPDKYQSTPIAV
jgi:hypothetical protein